MDTMRLGTPTPFNRRGAMGGPQIRYTLKMTQKLGVKYEYVKTGIPGNSLL